MHEVHLSNGKRFSCTDGASLLDAARRSGLTLEHSCRSGRCGACKIRVIKGATLTIGDESCLTSVERSEGWILSCARSASSDLQLDTADLGPLADIPVRILPCRISALDRLSIDVMRVGLRLPPGTVFHYLPGQHINLIGPNGLRRSYSLAGTPSALELELHIKRVTDGAMSSWLFEQAQVNDLLRIEGPLGSFFLRDPEGLHLTFLATGTGLAPITAMLHQLAMRPASAQPRSVSLYWGARHPQDHYWPLHSLWPELKFVPVLSKADAAWTGPRGHLQDHLLAEQKDWAGHVVYACGRSDMILDVRHRLLAAGLPAARFHSDAFVPSG